MSDRRFGLATVRAVEVDGTIGAEFVDNPDDICLKEYSEFKYGNGDVASKLGALLAEHFFAISETDPGDIIVTSSAYKAAPPAARALQDSFVQRIRKIYGTKSNVSTFKIHRSNITDGDYASMSLSQRQQVMAANGLILPEDLRVVGQDVVILDDISVTGSHEELLKNLFTPLDPLNVHYGYVLSVLNGKEFPGIEAAINATSVRSLADVLMLTESASFIPNARFCKFVLGLTVEQVEQFTRTVRPSLLDTMVGYIQEDGLTEVSCYRTAAEHFINLCLQRDLEEVR